ncbi:unnamed protein product [Pedinophyceae sp. YPF-701]|nr:unnamed protein product [Pedinophyceae sp. YPF-701]
MAEDELTGGPDGAVEEPAQELEATEAPAAPAEAAEASDADPPPAEDQGAAPGEPGDGEAVPPEGEAQNGEAFAYDDPEKVESAVVRIQSQFRGNKAREQVAAMKAAPAQDDTAGAADGPAEPQEGDAAPAASAAEQPEENFEYDDPAQVESAVVRIQSQFRGNKAREQVAALKAAKDTGDAEAAPAEEENFEYDDPAQVESAVVRIQSQFRGNKAREQVAKMRAGGDATEAAPAEEENFEYDDPAQVESAVVRIQSQFRGNKAREQVAKMRAGADATEAAPAEEEDDEDGEGGLLPAEEGMVLVRDNDTGKVQLVHGVSRRGLLIADDVDVPQQSPGMPAVPEEGRELAHVATSIVVNEEGGVSLSIAPAPAAAPPAQEEEEEEDDDDGPPLVSADDGVAIYRDGENVSIVQGVTKGGKVISKPFDSKSLRQRAESEMSGAAAAPSAPGEPEPAADAQAAAEELLALVRGEGPSSGAEVAAETSAPAAEEDAAAPADSPAAGGEAPEAVSEERQAAVEKRLASLVLSLEVGKIGEALHTAARAGLPADNPFVAAARGVMHVNKLSHEASAACQIRSLDAVEGILEQIAAAVPLGGESQEAFAARPEFERARRQCGLIALDQRALAAVELGDEAEMERVGEEAAELGATNVSRRLQLAQQLETTRVSVEDWMRSKERTARRERAAAKRSKRATQRRERKAREAKQQAAQDVYQGWLASKKDEERGRKAESEELQAFVQAEREAREKNEAAFREWQRRKAQQQAREDAQERKRRSRVGRLRAAVNASRQLEQRALRVMERTWDKSFHVATVWSPPDKRGELSEAEARAARVTALS